MNSYLAPFVLVINTVFSVTYVVFLKYSSIKKKSSPSERSENLSRSLLLKSTNA